MIRWTALLVIMMFAARASAADPFARGTRTLSLTGSYATPILGDDERYFTATAIGGYYFADRLAVDCSLALHGIDSWSGASGIATEANLLARWHFYTHEKLSLFVEGGCGFLYSDHELPADGHGTHWNFTPQGGIGATYYLHDNAYLLTGVRWFHASNAGLDGSDRHPGSNALMGYVGVLWTF